MPKVHHSRSCDDPIIYFFDEDDDVIDTVPRPRAQPVLGFDSCVHRNA
jgi:hypothetical protein